jgi:hypothetical protein
MSAVETLGRALTRAWRLTDAEATVLWGEKPDRLRLLYELHATLAALFVNPADEPRWLRDPLPVLEGLSPLADMVQNDRWGLVRVHDVVEHMAGRR